MPSAYIASLNRELERTSAVSTVTELDLRQRLVDWHERLPDVAKHRPFAMTEIEEALGTQGKHLSPIMLALGWVRRRRWSTAGQYNRYWVPPMVGDSPRL